MHNLVVFLANYLIFGLVLVVALSFLWVPRKRWLHYLILAALAGLLALIMAQIAGLLYYDPRPFVVMHKAPLVPHGTDNGFPSSHMLLAGLVACIVFTYNKKLGAVLLVVAMLVGLGRILALVHHPVDILASFIIAAVAVYLAYLIAGHLRVRWQKVA